ncbi:MAG: hypothetical protein V4620_01760 [Bacteroidota bacterium]
MLKQISIFTLVFVTSCVHSDKTNTTYNTQTTQETISEKENKVKNALAFINAYVENANKMNKAMGIMEWANSNSLTTKSFKAELKRIMEEAYKQDPELGLGADPIFDAQDNPDKGFELETFDENTNYLTVKGKEWPAFKLTMKMAEENGNWLVDGCGIINIPAGKKAKR